jgi:hypothetical protein
VPRLVSARLVSLQYAVSVLRAGAVVVTQQIETQIRIMRAAGLEDDEILRLASLRQRVVHGVCDDLTIEYKRAQFLKYLYDAGRLAN